MTGDYALLIGCHDLDTHQTLACGEDCFASLVSVKIKFGADPSQLRDDHLSDLPSVLSDAAIMDAPFDEPAGADDGRAMPHSLKCGGGPVRPAKRPRM